MAQDLSVPYIGYPSGPKPPSLPPRLPDRGTSLLRGILGMDPEWQSVMDPSAADNKKASNAGATISDLLNLLPLGSALKGPKVARSLSVPRLEANQKGAINLGGDPGFYLNHATRSPYFDDIANTGKFAGKDAGLIGPSLGVSYGRHNSYSPSSPSFVFRAGFGDDIFLPGSSHVNRDGYFNNPMGYTKDPQTGLKYFDPAAHANLLKYEQAQSMKAYGTPDLRLGQFSTSDWSDKSHAASIAFSPNFRTMKDFESSPFGGGALVRGADDVANDATWSKYKKWLNDEGFTSSELQTIYRKLNTNQALSPREETAWKLGRALPSSLSELKVPQLVGFSGRDGALVLPSTNFTSEVKQARMLRDNGIPIVSREELAALDPAYKGSVNDSSGRMMHTLAPPSGGLRLPPRLPSSSNDKLPVNSEAFLDFINDTPKDVWTSPHYVKKEVFDMGAKGGKFDPGLEIPTLGNFQFTPKALPPKLPTANPPKEGSPALAAWLEAQKPPPITPPKLTLGSDGTLGPMMQFAPAKKGWTKGTGPEQPGKVPKLQPGEVDLDNLFPATSLSSSVKPAPGAGPSAQMLKEMSMPDWAHDAPMVPSTLAKEFNIEESVMKKLLKTWEEGWLSENSPTFEQVMKNHFGLK